MTIRSARADHDVHGRSDVVDAGLQPHRIPALSDNWLVGGGEMGKVIRSMDWSHSPLGPIESWPQSLRTTVSLCLASNFPISLAWGPNHIQIYNDGYWPICGAKHPDSMGQDFSECWASAWPVIGDAFKRALGGETSYLENQRMFLDRNGYLEETFFTFSFSPIRDESGGVGGLFHPVTETTSRMLAERRTRTLRDIADRTGKAQTVEETFTLAAQTLADADLDLPFVLFYLLNESESGARLIAQTGLPPDTPASPLILDLDAGTSSQWELGGVIQGNRTEQVDDLEARFGPLHCGPYPEMPKSALALPITLPGHTSPIGILIAGTSSRLPKDDAYLAFYDLVAAGVTTSAANASARQEERKRAEALAEIDRAKTTFFSNVSHEFRTPLTLMLGPLEDELAEDIDPLPPGRHERLETVHRNSLRLLKLVNTLLDFSRIEAGRIQATYAPIDLAAYTTELASVFRSAIEKAGLTLTVDCPPLPETVYVDREMWEKVVLNLLSNAFKHTFTGGITVTLTWRGDHAELSVADTGVGIPDAERTRLFERFYRVKGTRSRTHEGTGIGLALVQELAGLHGGSVSVQSEEGQGSTFSVTVKAGTAHLPVDRIGVERTLASTATGVSAYVEEALHWLPDTNDTTPLLGTGAPATTDDIVPDSFHALTTSTSPSPIPMGEGWRSRGEGMSGSEGDVRGGVDPRAHILWADDNADLRTYVAGLLAPHYHVQIVADGQEALDAAQAKPPDLVLSDVMMPRLDGFGLLNALRADERTRTVPVILLSARAGEESAVEGLNAGADDYLAKPFSARELLARVRTHLELARTRRAWSAELEAANKELEAFSYSVSHDLRSPLRSIDGFSQLLLEEYGDSLDEDGKDMLQQVRDSGKTMSALIDALLELSQVTSHRLERENVSLTGLATSIARDLQRRDPKRRVEFTIEDNLTAECDARLLTVVLDNLIGNAWKYTSKKPRAHIAFGSSRQDGRTVYSVRDDGDGFDMTHADKLFNPFQRLHSAHEFSGSGIGLATVQRIIHRHGGQIWAQATKGQGATFYFWI